MQRALITGVGGSIGSHLAAERLCLAYASQRGAATSPGSPVNSGLFSSSSSRVRWSPDAICRARASSVGDCAMVRKRTPSAGLLPRTGTFRRRAGQGGSEATA